MGSANEILIAVTGDVVPQVPSDRGSFPNIFAKALDIPDARYSAIDLRHDERLPDAASEDRIVIVTGSAANVHRRAAWMLRAEDWLRRLVGNRKPVLGVCFGHQLLAQALGGEVQPNPRGREISTVSVECRRDDSAQQDPLLGSLTSFRANACHSDTVSRLPPNARALAHSSLDPHQVIRFAPRCYGVQFHPEFDEEIMGAYLSARSAAVRSEGLDVGQLRSQLAPTPDARFLLRRFVEKVATN